MSDSFDKTPEDASSDRFTASGSGSSGGSVVELGIDYPGLVQDALRQVVRGALEQVAAEGLPGEHHFYVSFHTGHRGVGLSDGLRAQYPDEMTIVIQHDYRDLEVDEVGFDVTLRFGGVPQSLRIPFAALTSFFDPSVHFMLRFDGADFDGGDQSDDLNGDLGLDEALAAESGDGSPARIPTDVLREADVTSAPFRPRVVAADDGDEDDEDDTSAGEVVSFEAFRRK